MYVDRPAGNDDLLHRATIGPHPLDGPMRSASSRPVDVRQRVGLRRSVDGYPALLDAHA